MAAASNPVSIESVEPRVLLSFASLNSHGTLSVVGTGKNNAIVVDFSGSRVRATVDGKTLTFNKSDVKRFWIDSFAGNDSITNKTTRPSTLIGSSGNDSILGGTGTDEIDVGTGADRASGGGGDNLITVNGSDDLLDYSTDVAGTFHVDNNPSGKFGVVSGIQVHYRNDTAADVLSGQPQILIALTPGNDEFFNEQFDDKHISVDMGKGDDTFTGSTGGADSVFGGDGNDTFNFNQDGVPHFVFGGAGNDHIIDNYGGTFVTIDAGSGTDTYDLTPDAVQITSPVYRHDVPAGVENVNFQPGGGQTNLLMFGNALNNNIDVFARGATIHGGSGNDRISVHVGTSGGGVEAGNSLFGESGDDTLIGDIGPDDLSGGSGHDTADYSQRGSSVRITLDNHSNDGTTGSDRIWIDPITPPPADAAPMDNVRADIETIIGGDANDFLQGNPFANKLIGGEGNDTLWGGDGNDTLIGGPGTDQLHGQGGTDVLTQ